MEALHSLTHKKLTFLLTALYLLNCTDFIFTATYIKCGTFYEANPIMQALLKHPYWAILLKLFCPALLISYLLHQINQIILKDYSIYQLGILGAFILYTLLNGLHLFYFVTYLIPIFL